MLQDTVGERGVCHRPSLCRGIVLIGAALLLVTACDKRDANPAASTVSYRVESQANSAPVTVNPTVLDLGPVQVATIAQHDVELINNSNHPLRVQRAMTSCGCTVAAIPKSPLPAHGRDMALVRFRAGGAVGTRSRKTVRFVIEGESEPVELTVTADIVDAVSITPRILNAQSEHDQRIVLQSADHQPFRILSVTPQIVRPFDKESRQEHEIWTTAELQSRYHNPQSITFALDHPALSSLAVVFGDVEAASHDSTANQVSIESAQIDFGDVARGTTSRKSIVFLQLSMPDAHPGIEGLKETISIRVIGVTAFSQGALMVMEISSTAEVPLLIDQTCTLVSGDTRVPFHVLANLH